MLCAAWAKAGSAHCAAFPSLFAKSGFTCRSSVQLLNCKNGVVYPSVLECAQLIAIGCMLGAQ